MLAKDFSIIRNYVLSVSSQRKYNFYHQNTLLDAFRTNSRKIIGRNPSMVIPLLANQDLMPMLFGRIDTSCFFSFTIGSGAYFNVLGRGVCESLVKAQVHSRMEKCFRQNGGL